MTQLRHLVRTPHRGLLALTLFALILLCAALPSPPARAASLPYVGTTLYSIGGGYPNINSGVDISIIVASDGNYYGTMPQAQDGSDVGSIFKLTPAGTFTTLKRFAPRSTSSDTDLNDPATKLVEGGDGALYGVARLGGANGFGLVYRITKDGQYSVLHSFTATEGNAVVTTGIYDLAPLQAGRNDDLLALTRSPSTGAISINRLDLSGNLTLIGSFDPNTEGDVVNYFQDVDGDLYGTLTQAGSSNGKVFKLTLAGVKTILHSFTQSVDGYSPAGLFRGTDGLLYGHAFFTDSNANFGFDDLIFSIDGTGQYREVKRFTAPPFSSGLAQFNQIVALFQLASGDLVGLARTGGGTSNDGNDGEVFDLAPDGTVTELYGFPIARDAGGQNRGGSAPGDLIPLANGNFVAVTYIGGANATGSVVSITPTVSTPAPTVTLSADPTSITLGQSTTLSWTSTNATSCTASGGWTGAEPVSGSQSVTPSETGSASYTLVCSGAGGSTSASTTVLVSAAPPPPQAPVVTISVTPASITVGQNATLSWSSSDAAASCTASGSWSGSEPSSGQLALEVGVGSYTYTLACTNAGGTGTASAPLQVLPAVQPPPPPPPPAPAPGGSITGHAGGGVGLDVLIGLGLLLMLREQRRRGVRRKLAAALAGVSVTLAAGSAAAQDTAGWPALSFDTAHAYVGLRGGGTTYGPSSGGLARSLTAQGDAVSGVFIDRGQVGGAAYAGVPVFGPLSVEAGFVELGRYELSIANATGNIAKTETDALNALHPAGRGGTLGLSGLFALQPWVSLQTRAALLVYDSRLVVDGPAGRFTRTRSGAGFDVGGTLLFTLTPGLYAGAGVDCYHTRSGCDVRLLSAQVEYHFGH